MPEPEQPHTSWSAATLARSLASTLTSSSSASLPTPGSPAPTQESRTSQPLVATPKGSDQTSNAFSQPLLPPDTPGTPDTRPVTTDYLLQLNETRKVVWEHYFKLHTALSELFSEPNPDKEDLSLTLQEFNSATANTNTTNAAFKEHISKYQHPALAPLYSQANELDRQISELSAKAPSPHTQEYRDAITQLQQQLSLV